MLCSSCGTYAPTYMPMFLLLAQSLEERVSAVKVLVAVLNLRTGLGNLLDALLEL